MQIIEHKLWETTVKSIKECEKEIIKNSRFRMYERWEKKMKKIKFKNNYKYINTTIYPLFDYYIYANKESKEHGFDNYLDYREYCTTDKEELEQVKEIQQEIDMYLQELKENEILLYTS